MVKLKFFDLKTKKPFSTDKFDLVSKNNRKMAVAISPSGFKAVRFVKKDFSK